jgi:hypothetical protein
MDTQKELFNNFYPKNLFCLKCELEKKQKEYLGKHWIACSCSKVSTLQEQIEREELIKELYNQSLKADK